MILTAKIALIISGILLAAGAVQWTAMKNRQVRRGQLLDCAQEVCRDEQERLTREISLKKEEEERQAHRTFGLDFLITHGGAFGGCAATCPDGRIRKGSVALDQILMYGRQPSGKDFTYYIEDQDLLICASDDPDTLLVKALTQPFEIREEGLSRDQGTSTQTAVIRKDILYYIILESRHEISIRATARC